MASTADNSTQINIAGGCNYNEDARCHAERSILGGIRAATARRLTFDPQAIPGCCSAVDASFTPYHVPRGLSIPQSMLFTGGTVRYLPGEPSS